jgi:hypothetical protein
MAGAHETGWSDGFGVVAIRPLCLVPAGNRAGEPDDEFVTLADAVVHRLWAVGLATRSLLTNIADPEVAGLAEPILDGLDDTINEIRTAVFHRQAQARSTGRS